MRWLFKYGFVLILLSGVVLIHLQGHFSIVEDSDLKRKIPSEAYPELDWPTWTSTKYQQAAGDAIKRNIGFFNSILMGFNQTEYSAFQRAHAKDVVVGKNGYLYEEKYIDAYYGTDLLSDSFIEAKTERWALLKRGLDSLGIQLMVVFAPGKGGYFPEYFPTQLERTAPAEKNNISEYQRMLDEENIEYLDLNQWFVQQKKESPYPLYSKKGVHWTHYGMIRSIDTLIHFTEQLMACDLPDINVRSLETSSIPKATDGDIEEGMNLMFLENEEMLAYANYDYEKGAFDSLSALLVGDSYALGLYNRQLLTKSFSSSQFWYYNNTLYKPGSPCNSCKTINWLEAVKENDLVILLATDGSIPRFDWDFTKRALYHLYPMYPDHRAQYLRVQELIVEIKDNQETINQLSKKVTECFDLERAIELEAERRYWKEEH